MKLRYDLVSEDFMVGEQSLVDFYVAARRDAKISISKLEKDSWLTRGTLRNIEIPPKCRPKKSKSIRAILIALETLGFSLEVND